MFDRFWILAIPSFEEGCLEILHYKFPSFDRALDMAKELDKTMPHEIYIFESRAKVDNKEVTAPKGMGF